MSVSNEKLLSELGQIKGMLEGVFKLVTTHEQNLNRRIDDMMRSFNGRLDEHERDIRGIGEMASDARTVAAAAKSVVEQDRRDAIKAGGISGAALAGAMTAGIEIIRAFLRH